LNETKSNHFSFLTATNPYDRLQRSSRTLTVARSNGKLSEVRECLNNRTELRSPGVGSVQSSFENDPSTLCLENSESSKSLLKASNILSAEYQPSPTISSPEDSMDSDMFSISGSSDDTDLLYCQESINPSLNKLVHQLLAAFRAAAQYQSSPDKGKENSTQVASIPVSSYSGNTLSTSSKRKYVQDEEDSTAEDGSHPLRPKRRKAVQSEKPQKSLACPYWKKDMSKHSTCCKFKLSRVRDVKLHLQRKHTPKEYCQRCQKTFADDHSLQAHITIGKCSRRDPTELNGISYGQSFQLRKKSQKNASAEEQWFAIWDILFPGHQRPSTVYVDTDLAQIMRQFREHCESQGPTMIAELVESDPAWLSFDTIEEQRRILRRSIAQGITNLFDDWHMNDLSNSEFPEYLSNHNLQQSRYETSTGSLMDSGVAVDGQSSYRESTSERSEPHPSFTFPTAELGVDPVAAITSGEGPSSGQDSLVLENLADTLTLRHDLFPSTPEVDWGLYCELNPPDGSVPDGSGQPWLD
jgi:hypothetical protein